MSGMNRSRRAALSARSSSSRQDRPSAAARGGGASSGGPCPGRSPLSALRVAQLARSAPHARRLPQISAVLHFVRGGARGEFGEISRPWRHAGRRSVARRAGFTALLDRLLDDLPHRAVSYLSLRLQARFRSPAAIEALTRKKHLRNARRIQRTISRLQGLFIKVGQLISIMTNFLPEEFRAELEGLQDQVPPRPYEDIEQRFREEFDGKLPRRAVRRVRAAADRLGVDRPGAPRARCTTGEAVAVKVQYPDIEEIVAHRSARAAPHLRHHLLVHPLPGPRRHLPRDPRHDPAGARLPRRGRQHRAHRRALHAAARDVAFPDGAARAVDRAHPHAPSGSTGSRSPTARGSTRSASIAARLARAVVTAYCQQIFTDGVYHADPHPGNLLVRKLAVGRGDRSCSSTSARSPRSRRSMRRGIVDLIQARARARHGRAGAGDEGDGLHRARRRPGDLRQGHRLPAPEVPGGDPARVASRSRT